MESCVCGIPCCFHLVFDTSSLHCRTPPLSTAELFSLDPDNQEFPLRYAANLQSAGHEKTAHQEFNRIIKALNHVWFYTEGGSAVPKIPRPGAEAHGEYVAFGGWTEGEERGETFLFPFYTLVQVGTRVRKQFRDEAAS